MKQLFTILIMCCATGLASAGPTLELSPPFTAQGALSTPVVYHGDTIFAPLAGVVVAIRDDGAMYIKNALPAANDPGALPIKEWSLSIEPGNAEIITLGREIECQIYGETSTEVYASCGVVIRPKEETALTQSYGGVSERREPLSRLAVTMGLGKVEDCSEDERLIAESAEGLQSILRSLCK